MKNNVLFACLFAFGAALADTNELAVARAALRDELWSIARTHASRVNSDDARQIILESYAQEKDWKGLLASVDAMGYPTGDTYAYYRAVALFHEGAITEASNILATTSFAQEDYKRAGARLRAQMAHAAGQDDRALEILTQDGGTDVDTTMLKVLILRHQQRLDAAKVLLRGVLAATNASEYARVQAAAELADVATLAALSTNAASQTVRHIATLNLGVVLVQNPTTFTKGETLIRDAVRDKPDEQLAYESFFKLAAARLKQQEWAEALKTYDNAQEIWPSAIKDVFLHEGRGWALLKLGRLSEALDAFTLAESLANTPADKAAAAVKRGDILTLQGKIQEATDLYRHVRNDYPNTPAAHAVTEVIRLREKEDIGRALFHAYKFSEALQTFQELAREDPQSSDRMTYYGMLCTYGAGKDETAETIARNLATHATDATVRTEATHWLAKYAFNRGRWHEAQQLFKAFVEAAPNKDDAPMALVWSARAALADNDFKAVISNVTQLVAQYPQSPACTAGMRAQGEALIELGRFDEAILVLERATLITGGSPADRLAARILRADALFAMGADNPIRYRAALEAYQAIRTSEDLSPSMELILAFKVAKTLEKLKQLDEAMDMYYTHVILAYRTSRIAGTDYDDEARAVFSRAAFRLAEEHERRGRVRQAVHVLKLVQTSDVPAANEAAKRIHRITQKGLP